MKNERLLKRIDMLLSERPRTSRELYTEINQTSKYGTTPHQIGNVLKCSNKYKALGQTSVMQTNNQIYEMVIWGLVNEE